MIHPFQNSMRHFVKGIFFISLQFQVSAQTYIWTGTGTGGDGISWHDDDNWNRNAKPLAGAEVSIGNDSVVISTNEDAAWVSLEDAQLTILGKLQLNNGDTFAISAVNSQILNSGVLIIEESGQDEFGDRAIELLAGSSFQNDSICLILTSDGGGVRLEGGSTYTNNGHLSINCNRNGIALTSFSNFTNNDSVMINSASTAIWTTSGANFINNNFVEAQAGDAVAAVRASSGGQVNNYGLLTVNTVGTDSAILCNGTGSEFNHFSGLIICTSTGAHTLVRISSNSLFTISSGAVLDVSGSTSTDLLNIENDCIVTWDGIVAINN